MWKLIEMKMKKSNNTNEQTLVLILISTNSRMLGVDYTIVHKESGSYVKIDASKLPSFVDPSVMKNVRKLKPTIAQSREFSNFSYGV